MSFFENAWWKDKEGNLLRNPEGGVDYGGLLSGFGQNLVNNLVPFQKGPDRPPATGFTSLIHRWMRHVPSFPAHIELISHDGHAILWHTFCMFETSFLQKSGKR